VKNTDDGGEKVTQLGGASDNFDALAANGVPYEIWLPKRCESCVLFAEGAFLVLQARPYLAGA
jgi:hypothetical protein